MRHPVYTSVLALSWMILQGRLSLTDLAIGYLVGLVVVWLCYDFWAERVTIKKVGTMLRLAAVFVKEIILANLHVAWIIVQPKMPIHPAFIVLPLRLRDDLQIAALANMITLTPGTLTIDVAPDRSALYIHCLDAADADAVREQIKRQFETPLDEGVQCSPL